MGIVYGLQLTLFGVLSPIFLLFGCWAGRGTDIAKRYFGTMLATTLKRIGTTLLMMISILLVTNSMSLINSVGVVQSLVFIIVISTVIFKKRHELLNMFQLGNFGQLQLMQHLNKATSRVTGIGKDVGDVATNGVVGGIAGFRNGLGLNGKENIQDTLHETFRGATSAVASNIQDKMYRSHVGRMTNTLIRNMSHNEEDHYCIECGVKLHDGLAYVDENGLYYCEECAAARNFEDLSAVTLDTHNEGYSFTNGNHKSIVIKKDNEGNIVEGKASHVTIDEWAKNQSAEKAVQQASDSMAIIYDDTNNVRNSYQNHSVKSVFIPTPLRTTLMNSEMRELTVKSQNEDKALESINNIESKFENAWKEVLTNKLKDTSDYKNNYLDDKGEVKNQEEADKWINDNIAKFEENLDDIKSQYKTDEEVDKTEDVKENKKENIENEDSK